MINNVKVFALKSGRSLLYHTSVQISKAKKEFQVNFMWE